MRKTQEEIDAMSPAELAIYKRQQQNIVFGEDAPRDARGRPVEHGIGSPLHPTANHVQALRNSINNGWVKDPDGSILAKEEKRLADYEARQGRMMEEDDGPVSSSPAPDPQWRPDSYRVTDTYREPKKRPGNPAGLIKARAAAKAKREARSMNENAS
jgi:hypothetical protein